MSSVNKAIIIGRLGDDPDVRYTQNNTAVANLSIATSERYKDKQGEWKERTEWHRVVLWDRLAETAQEYLQKGNRAYIEGSIQTRKWEDKEGNTKYTTEIKGYKLVMLGDKGESENNPIDSDVDMNEIDNVDDQLPF